MRLPQDASTPQLCANAIGDEFQVYDESTGRTIARGIEARHIAELLAAAYLMREALRLARYWHDDGTPLDAMSESEQRTIKAIDYALAAANGTR